jgi:hypothetical protein
VLNEALDYLHDVAESGASADSGRKGRA